VRKNPIPGSRKYFFVCHLMWVLVVCLASTGFGDAQISSHNTDESWTTSSENLTDQSNPYRTIESHTKSGYRTVDNKTVEVRGPNGQYELYFRVETETIQESPTSTRSIVRTYNPGGDRNEHLTQITEVEARDSGDVSRVEKTMSSADLDGKFQVKERETTVITKGSDGQRTQTTAYLPNTTGEFVPSMEVNEQQKRSPNGTIETKKETLFPELSGRWQTYEVHEQTVRGNDQNRTTDDRVFRRDYVGNISPLSEVVTTETNANGQSTTSSQTYSVDVPGSARDGSMHPFQSSTLVRTTEPTRTITQTQVVRSDAEEKGMNSVFTTMDIKTQGSSGTEETITVTARYPDGYPSVVSVEKRKSEGEH
jgi:hypothetical protein